MRISFTRRRVRRALPTLLIAGGLLAAGTLAPTGSTKAADGSDPWRVCRQAIDNAERNGAIPKQLLASIALNESGRPNPVLKKRDPWPWTVTARGEGHFFESKSEAIAYVRELRRQDVGNIDVGCMQINLGYHPNAFRDLDEAFDPTANTTYGASHLRTLYSRTGSWFQSAGLYHSGALERHEWYRNRVLTTWNQQRRAAGLMELAPKSLFGLPPLGVERQRVLIRYRNGDAVLPATVIAPTVDPGAPAINAPAEPIWGARSPAGGSPSLPGDAAPAPTRAPADRGAAGGMESAPDPRFVAVGVARETLLANRPSVVSDGDPGRGVVKTPGN